MPSSTMFAPRRVELSLPQRVIRLNWLMILCVIAIAAIGIAMLYSVANGNMEPWAQTQLTRFVPLLLLMIAVAVTDLRIWLTLAYPAYAAGIAMLIAVEVIGVTGMGGQRWLDLGVMRVQPSELMKIALVMALARFYHSIGHWRARQVKTLVIPLALIIVPVLLVARQPDLGTSLMILMGGLVIVFLSGAPLWLFITGGVAVAAAVPIVWQFLLLDYQKQRILTFLDPSSDPLGAGYQITQSKIALGSGGVEGKGFLQGTQSHLNFLPEMKTDFIFTVLAEEFGLIGALALISLYMIVLGYGLMVGLACRSQFGRLLSSGLVFALFLYVFINIAMVMGLVPVVGVPLPLVSYGGSAMLTMLVAYGLILSVALHRQIKIPRHNAMTI